MSSPAAATLLVVDDNRLVRELIRDTFLDAGFSVLTAGDGREALERIGETRPDVIITDITMPGMDGWAFCEALKADPQTRDLPLVFLSGQREIPQRLRGLRLGAYDYLTKPFSTEELLLRVKLVIERTKSGNAAAETSRSFLSGHTSHLPIADLVQLLSMNDKTGCLRLRGHEAARIHFRSGRIMGAFTARTRGRKALFRVLGWTNCDFHFDPADDVSIVDDIRSNTQDLLMDGLVALDDLRRALADVPAPEEPLALAEPAQQLAASPDDVGPVERDVLREARQRPTVRELLDRLEASDLDIARAIARLVETKALVPVSRTRAAGALGSDG